MTRSSTRLLPRAIDPSLIEVGDTIQVTLPPNKGMVTKHVGKVHHRNDYGGVRYLYTEEGATLLAWEAKRPRAITVLLLAREDYEQIPLFNMELPERLVG